ncbi:hypothetical protein EJ08DRAFT_490322 [Tothia fuscella]|uniref:Uncharacterized protein n=1 Tax=Tothia fuscella TaxID=1048955 RepID=A0A9P4NHI2_9PEZI|nr:hypothetical protein EJ08DRAFT_490322 [Tothia fuscella]
MSPDCFAPFWIGVYPLLILRLPTFPLVAPMAMIMLPRIGIATIKNLLVVASDQMVETAAPSTGESGGMIAYIAEDLRSTTRVLVLLYLGKSVLIAASLTAIPVPKPSQLGIGMQ